MEKNLDSTTKLTEFAPLSPEPEDSPGFGYLLSKIFKRNNGNDVKQPTLPTDAGTSDLPVSTDTHWQDTPEFKEICADPNTSLHDKTDQYRIENSEGRSLPNVLKRISNLLALTNSGYKDTELKQYWMPDSVSKECYDCGEKFTTFRRRHHCRVCGQIFCSRCCNREIPGKLMGFTRMQNSLRVCTYCGKVVLSYLQSADMGADMTADLRALQEDLQTKFGNSSGSSAIVSLASSQTTNVSNYSSSSGEREEPVKRKPSVGYQEEKFVQGRNFGGGTLSGLDENNGSNQALRSLYDELVHPNRGITIGTHKHKLQSYPNCFTGSELVDWLMLQNRVSIRAQGAAISQTLLDSNFIECVTREFAQFCDGYTLYRLCTIRSPSRTPPLSIITHSDQEELWPPDTPQDSTTTDSESECPPSETNLPSSASLFRLDLNLEDSTVHISRPPQQPLASASKKSKSIINKAVPNTKTNEGDKHVHAVVQSYREGTIQAPHIVNWHKVYPHQLRVDNGEKQAYEALNSGFNLHLQGFLKQVLNREGLSQSWADIVVPLAHQVVDTIKPDLRTDTDDMDIRKYVQLKKVSGGIRSDSCIVAGVVCCKNLAHRAMPTRLTNPRILLLSCAIVYQRIEGRLMSLEPVMMQEQEYLRHVVARIAALEPDLVLVQKNVSRLAQESLLKLGITLALNVKPSVLERVARVTKADILKSIDAQVGGRPQLGTCKYFYVKTFTTENDIPKTLMFLEGCSSPHLGCTVLLRGAPTSELAKLKRVASWLIFAVYNWRLERSFLMDEFANPPTVSVDNFFEDIPSSEKKKKLQDSKSVDSLRDKFGLPVTTSSPMEEVTGVLNGSPASMQLFQPSKIDDENNRVNNRLDDIESSRSRKVAIKTSSEIEFDSKKGLSVSEYNSDKLNEYSSKNNSRLIIKDKSLSDERKMNVESISDFSDPLHQYLNLEDEVFSEHPTGQALSVEELPQPNRFRQALDDTILSVSPFLKFCVPYLETESGRNCRLRQYFPKEVYWSAQLTDHAAVGRTASVDTFHKDIPNKLNGTVLAPKHPYVTTKLTSPSKSREVQTLLANFRAVGGRLQLPDKSNETTVVPVTTVQTVSTVASPIDALDPSKHQRLAVLFCSYSSVSHNAPAFCVNPWVVHMDFYGRNDIPLGAFLERYCFRTTYVCPSEDCDTPMLSHIRRFVHDGGAVHISLKEIEVSSQTDDSVIIMWSWCPQCNLVSPIMPMSPDTWSLSFAKYLELRCHGSIYSTRGLPDSACKHSLHQDCCQFFGYKNLVATFQYTKIAVWEISLPPLMLVTQRVQHNIQQNSILEEVKKWSLNGYEVFSAILSKLCNLAVIGEGVPALKLQLQKEQAVFKSLVEEIQVRLTSPTLENKSFFPSNEDSVTISLWQLEDSLVLLKRHVAEAVAKWNITLAELETTIHTKKREEKNKKSQPDNKSVSSAGLSDIIEGMISSHFTEAHLLGDDGLPKESEGKILPSQLSQISLHSALEVDVEESSDLVYCQDSISETIPTFNPTEKLHDDKMDTDSHHEVSTDESAAVFGSTDMNESEQQENAVKNSESGEFVCGYEEPVSLQEESTNKILYSDSDNEHLLENDEGEPAGVVVKSQPSDKISVKTILSQLLPIAPTSTPIQCPMSPQEHHCLPLSMSVPVVVYDSELSSIIAYALGSNEYRKGLAELRAKSLSSIDQHSPSPIAKRKSGGSDSSRENSTDLNNVGKPGMLSFLRSATVNSNSNITTGLSVRSSNEGIQYSSINSSDSASHTPMETDEGVKVEAETSKGKTNKSQSSSDLEIPFSDVSTTFTVKIYYADEFARLRETIFPAGEEAYIRSLSRSIQWAARGGKSGSNFAKTKDDRFILKEMSRTETHPFMESAPQYFAYMNNCVASKSPTLLGKIVGVYRVRNSNNTSRSNLLVMENLFHGRSVRNKFDLKGSVRNRLVNPNEQEGEIVLLDENLINMTCDNPLYMLPHSKTVLMQAIHNDTKFLASLSVMDYSLLVGQDEKNKELVVGIIDYIRTFTWDKKLETMVKKSGLLGGQGKLPTIVSPDEYRDRFIAAMHRYFLPVPDRWIGLGYTSMWEILLSYISRLRRKGKYSREFNLEHEDDKVMYTKKTVQ